MAPSLNRQAPRKVAQVTDDGIALQDMTPPRSEQSTPRQHKKGSNLFRFGGAHIPDLPSGKE
jgi:hypothetical protein